VTTSVSSLKTAATDLGATPVRCCWKSLAAGATCRAMVGLDLFMSFIPPGCGRQRATKHKKNDVVNHLKVFDHVGLLINAPPGTSGLPVI
jgi:hypothetical protein